MLEVSDDYICNVNIYLLMIEKTNQQSQSTSTTYEDARMFERKYIATIDFEIDYILILYNL